MQTMREVGVSLFARIPVGVCLVLFEKTGSRAPRCFCVSLLAFLPKNDSQKVSSTRRLRGLKTVMWCVSRYRHASLAQQGTSGSPKCSSQEARAAEDTSLVAMDTSQEAAPGASSDLESEPYVLSQEEAETIATFPVPQVSKGRMVSSRVGFRDFMESDSGPRSLE